jgi:ATP-binding cassette subfamily F protein uup
MATLLSARDLGKSFASQTLFTGVGVHLADGDRVGLIGPNGAGKSTLLKILAGLEPPDDGEITRRRGLRMAYVEQDDRFAPGATPRSVVTDRLEREADDPRVDVATRAAVTLSRLGFADPDQSVETLSGGWCKRVSIGAALALEPELLLLDEPTNHLDLEGILWLEQLVRQARMAVVFITHDRRFLENVAGRIVELSPAYPGGTFEVTGNYTEFVRRKADFLDAQAAAQSALANKVRRDTAWLQQGIQGRQTRNKTQVADAAGRRDELRAVRDRNAAPGRRTEIDFQATERKTRKLLALHNVAKSMGGRTLFRNLDLTLAPGRRVGLMGANGSGKTTLLRLMAGKIEPDEGTIKPAVDLRIVTFSQHRCDLVATQTLQEALCPVGDVVEYRGRSVHSS